MSAQLSGLAPTTTYHYRLVVTNPDGRAVGADRTFRTTIAARPVISKLSLTPAAFRPARGGASVAAKRRSHRSGTTVTYAVDMPATLRFTVQRATRGRRTGGHCRRPTAKNRGKRTCTRWVAVRGSFSHADGAGTQRFHFTGRLNGRALRHGRYHLAAVATSAFGKRSRARRATFAVLPPPRRHG